MFFKMVNIQTVLLCYILCGFLCRKKRIITVENQQAFVNLLLWIFMPCMVFDSFKNVTVTMLKNSFIMLLVAFVICIVSSAIGKVLYRKFPEDRKNILRYATVINNAGFAGLPLTKEVFGAEGVLYASVFLIPIRIFMWSAGITMLSKQKTNVKNIAICLLKNPCIIAVFLGLFRGVMKITLPVFLENTISALSACVSPFSMMIIGAMIADVNWKGLFDKGVFLYTGMRLLVLPVIALALCRAIGLDEMIAGTAMILTSMPAATTTALLAAKYEADVTYASKLVFTTTVLSLFTAPVLILFLK